MQTRINIYIYLYTFIWIETFTNLKLNWGHGIQEFCYQTTLWRRMMSDVFNCAVRFNCFKDGDSEKSRCIDYTQDGCNMVMYSICYIKPTIICFVDLFVPKPQLVTSNGSAMNPWMVGVCCFLGDTLLQDVKRLFGHSWGPKEKHKKHKHEKQVLFLPRLAYFSK